MLPHWGKGCLPPGSWGFATPTHDLRRFSHQCVPFSPSSKGLAECWQFWSSCFFWTAASQRLSLFRLGIEVDVCPGPLLNWHLRKQEEEAATIMPWDPVMFRLCSGKQQLFVNPSSNSMWQNDFVKMFPGSIQRFHSLCVIQPSITQDLPSRIVQPVIPIHLKAESIQLLHVPLMGTCWVLMLFP